MIYEKQDLYHYLNLYSQEEHVSFHMPGHKGSDFFRRLGYGDYIDRLVDMDITEIPGADDLFDPQGPIKNVMDRYKATYRSKETFLSVGGSSAGNLAAILSSTEPGDAIITNRDCHRSVTNAAKIRGLEIVFTENPLLEDFEIPTATTAQAVEEAFRTAEDQGKNVSAVVITSPNYYGLISEIPKIAELAHARGAVFIVDQAHGAHLIYMDGGRHAAEIHGGDIVINSIHKTLAGFTQTSIVNVCSDMVDVEKLQEWLKMLQSSSPSYILMASLSLNINIMNRYWQDLIGNWQRNLDYFYSEVQKTGEDGEVMVLEDDIFNMFDRTKLVFSHLDIGNRGQEHMKYFMDRNIYFERAEDYCIVGMTGVGNKREDYDRLLEALYSAKDVEF